MTTPHVQVFSKSHLCADWPKASLTRDPAELLFTPIASRLSLLKRQVISVTVGAKCTQLWARRKNAHDHTLTLKPVYHSLRAVVQRVRDAITACAWVRLAIIFSLRDQHSRQIFLCSTCVKKIHGNPIMQLLMYALSSPATKLCHTCWQLILLNNVLPSFVLVNRYVIRSIYAIFMFGRHKWVRVAH